jgi:hypothetical protein
MTSKQICTKFWSLQWFEIIQKTENTSKAIGPRCAQSPRGIVQPARALHGPRPLGLALHGNPCVGRHALAAATVTTAARNRARRRRLCKYAATALTGTRGRRWAADRRLQAAERWWLSGPATCATETEDKVSYGRQRGGDGVTYQQWGRRRPDELGSRTRRRFRR